eukprot:9180645-Pyramimonas_sp.AAC.1
MRKHDTSYRYKVNCVYLLRGRAECERDRHLLPGEQLAPVWLKVHHRARVGVVPSSVTRLVEVE